LIFLLSDVSTKKSMAFSHNHSLQSEDLLKFTKVAGEKCFYGSVQYMTNLMKVNSESYRSGLTVNDNVQKILSFVDKFSKFEVAVINGTVSATQTEDFGKHLNPLIAEYQETSVDGTTLADPLMDFMALSNKQQIDRVDEIYSAFMSQFDQHLNKDGQKPSFFNEDMKRYTTYSRQYKLWNSIYNQDTNECFPTDSQKSEVCFNELLKDHNCENLNVSDVIEKKVDLPKNYFSENGGIVFAFWAKTSLSKVMEGDITVFKINKSDNITKLVYSLGTDEQSVDMKLCVGTECVTVNNTADCEDYTYNLVAIQKKVDHYTLSWVVKSWVLNSRSAYTINISPSFIENSSVEFSSTNIVNESDIKLFKNYCFDIFNVEHLKKENEMVSIMCGSSWASKLEEVTEVCNVKPPMCDYLNPDASCAVCEEDAKSYRHSCIKECPMLTFENDDKECIDCCPKKQCKTCDKDGCTDCNSPLVLNGNKCSEKCPEDQFPKIIEEGKAPVCTPCLTGCAECDGATSCISCKDQQYLLNNKECKDTCPKGFYHSEDFPLRCIPCPNGCETCTSSDHCDSCKNTFYLHNNKCDSNCPKGTYKDSESNTCEDCENNCAACSDSKNCVLCEEEFHLHEGDCVSTCPSGYVSINNVCVPCSDANCDTCAPKADNCTKCLQNTGIALYVFNKKCQDDCPEGYRKNDETMRCDECIKEHCTKCPAKGGCTQCESPYMLKVDSTGTFCVSKCGPGYVPNNEADECVECSKANNCKKCCQKDTEKCTKCYEEGFPWLYKPKCVEVCPENTYKVEKECFDCNESCKTCSSDASCDTCPDGKVYDDGECFATCGQGKTDVNNICNPCKKNDCDNCDTDIESCDICKDKLFKINGSCVESCPEGYYVEGDECKECHDNCKICTDATTCIRCHLKDNTDQNLYLDEITCVYKCKAGYSPNAINTCQKCVEDSCLKCNHENNHCTKCPTDKPLLFNHKCVDKCEDGYVVDTVNNTCVECDSPCKTCSLTTTNCETCIETYEFMAKEHTKDQRENRCVNECPEIGYIEVNKKCIPCDDAHCKTCAMHKSECDVCKINPDNQKVLNNYECVDNCEPKMYVHNNKCKHCGEHCSICKDAEKCTVCDETYYLKDGVCVKPCGFGYTKDEETKRCVKCGEGCKKCDPKNPQNCTECPETQVLHAKKCIDVCPAGYTENIETNKCESCIVTSCLKCDGHKDICEKCEKILYENQCIDPCPEYTREINHNGQRSCQKCSVNSEMDWTLTHCLNCPKDKDTCKMCQEDSFLNTVTDKCVDICPDGTYISNDARKCLPCDKQCNTCVHDEVCTSCKDENVLRKDGTCHSSCPCGQVAVDQVCKDCIDNCRKCFAADHTTKCHECKKDYYLQPESHTCKLDCPDGYYPNIENKKCVKCNEKCLTCTSSTECTECKIGYVNHNGSCDDSCPSGYIEDNVNKICVKCETTTHCKKCRSVDKLDECVECMDVNWVLHGDPHDCKEKCPSNHFLEGKYCIPCKDRCQTCESAEECDKCVTPYVLFENNCYVECRPNYVNIAGKCEKCNHPHCQICNTDKECEQCTSPKYLKDLLCVDKCGDGYYQEDGKCHKCKDNCKKCSGPDDCQKCNGNLVLYDNECVETCPAGTVNLNNAGICKNCDTGCNKCSVANAKTCEECINPLVLQGTTCQNNCNKGFVEKVVNPGYCIPCQLNCTKCCPKTDNCDICEAGFVVQVDKKTCDTTCKDGEIEVNGKCKPCDIKDCSICPNKKDCTQCIEPKVLHKPTETSAAVCVTACPDPYYKSVTSKCDKCPEECESCHAYDKCTICMPGHFLFEGKCKIDCTEGQVKIDGHCINCTTPNCSNCPVKADTCTDCKGDLKLYQNICHDECIEGTYEIPNDKCKICSNECQICIDDSKCTKCYSPSVLQGNHCQENCNNGYVNVNGVCIACEDEGCKKCKKDTKECKQCYDTFFLIDGYCTNDCGDGYFEKENGDNDICSPCLDMCRVCESSNTCKECNDPFVVQKKPEGVKCQQICDKGYSTHDGKICKKCTGSNCEECPNILDQCTKCEPSFYLKHGKCVPECPDYYYESESDKTCKECFPECPKCNNGTHCELCEEPLVLSHNKLECLTKCPKATVLIITATSKKCHLCDDSNCEICLQDKSTCEKCQENYLDENGKCVPECGPTFFENIETNTCDKCEINCLQCDNEKDCTKCNVGTFLDEGDCKPTCPAGKHPNSHNECKPCKVDHCHTCANGYEKCDKCKQPKVLQGNECVDECLPGFYHNEERICKPCGNKCHRCLNHETCVQCTLPNVLLLTGKCDTVCPSGQYDVEVNDAVHPADPSYPLVKCKNCSTLGCIKCPNDECTECNKNDPKLFLNSDKICEEDCGDKYFENNTNGKCDLCIENCQICSNGKQCEKCYKNETGEGFVLYNHTCHEKCLDGYVAINGRCTPCNKNCKKCVANATKDCVECDDTFSLFNHTCHEPCPVNTFETVESSLSICKNCPKECESCDSTDKCNSCKLGYVLQEGKCITTCTSGYVEVAGDICKECVDADCDTCNPTDLNECTTCKNSKVLLNGDCVDKCGEGYYVQDAKCYPCSKNCNFCSSGNDCQVCVAGNHFVGDSEVCDVCPDDHVIIGDRCYECSVSNCNLCVAGDKDKCNTCDSGYVLDDHKCPTTCPLYKYEKDGKCSRCEELCEVCTSDTNCTKCASPNLLHLGDCVPLCPNHYVKHPTEDKCIPCSDISKCIVCKAENTNECIECESNSVLHDGICKEKCPKGHYLVGTDCKDCSKNCESCTDNQSCNICDDGFFLKNGKCVDDCKDGYRVENNEKCVKCTTNCKECNADQCLICVVGKVLLEGVCVDVCSAETYNNNGICEPCSQGCLLCETKDICDKCQDNMAINSVGECVTDCGSGKTFLNGHCVKCKHPDCKMCEKENPENCDKCKSLYTHEDTCTDECPEGMVEDVVKKVCVDCDPTCKECKSNTEVNICTECHEPMILHDGKCINECPSGTRLVHDKCEECADENCSLCGTDTTKPSEETCFECEKGYSLYKGTCHNDCPIGTYTIVFQNGASKCQKCHKGCVNCLNDDTCEECTSGYYLDQETKQCVHHCPVGFYGDCYENICKPCDSACKSCIWEGADKCTVCQDSFISKDDVCLLQCPKNMFADSETKVCTRCELHACETCSSEFICEICSGDYYSKNGVCTPQDIVPKPLLKGGNLLLSPISSEYGQKSSFSLVEDLSGYGVLSNNFSFSFFIKSVGTTQVITDNAHSQIFDYKINATVGLTFNVLRVSGRSVCGVHLYDQNVNKEMKFTKFDCSDSALFEYKYIYLNIHTDKFQKEVTISYTYFDETDSKYKQEHLPTVQMPDIVNAAELTSSIVFLDKSEYNGYLISKFNIGNFEFSNALITSSANDTPKPASWLCNGGVSCNESGLIPLVKGFVKFDEINKIYNLRDSFDVPSIVQSETSYGLKFYIFIDELPENKKTTLGTISYEYKKDDSLGKVIALKLVANTVSTENLTLVGNTLNLPSSLKIKARTWYIVSFGIRSDATSTIYSAIVKDEKAVQLFSDSFNATDTKIDETIKLIIDASISFGTGSGQVYDPQVLISNDINNYDKAISDIKGSALCEKYTRDFACQTCIQYYKIVEGKCESNFMEHGDQLLFHYPEFENSDNGADRPAYHVYNTNQKEILIPTDSKYADQWTVIIYLRKLVHSVYTKGMAASRLISLRGSEEVLPIVMEQIHPDYQSEFQIGHDTENKFNVDLGDVVFDYHKVFISRKGDNIKIYYFEGVIHKTSVTCKNISAIVFGDRFGNEIHHEFKNIYIYPQFSSQKNVEKLTKIDIIDSDPTCVLPNYLTGFCIKCNSPKRKPEQTGCNTSLFGFQFNYTFGFTSFNGISAKNKYINNYKDFNLPDVNSLSYGIFGFVRPLIIHQIDSNNNAKLNLFKIVNNAHNHYYNVDPSNNLLEFNIEVKEGKAKYVLNVNTSVGKNRLVIENLAPVTGQWVYVGLKVDVLQKQLKYSVQIKDDDLSNKSGIFDLNGFPEKLQDISQLISYAVNSHASEHYSVLNGETQNLYIIPNLSNYDGVKGYIKNRMEPNQATPQENCEVTLNNNTQSFCVECQDGFVFVNDVCTASGLVVADGSGIFAMKPFESGKILSGEQTYPANDDFIFQTMTINLSFYFRFNFTEKNKYHEILKIGSVTVGAVFSDFHAHLKINLLNKDFLMGPLETNKMFDWMSFNISYEMTEIYANIRYTGNSLSTIAHQFKHTTSAALVLPEEYTILDGHNLVQVFGLHLSDKNYGKAMIPEPFSFDCGIDCEECKYGKCTSGKYGIDEDTLTPKFREISVAKVVNKFIPMTSIGDKFELALLRSRNYSFYFIYISDNEKLKNNMPNSGKYWNNVMTISLGDLPDSEDTNEIKIEQSLIDTRKYRITYENQYTNTHLENTPTEEFQLPSIPTNENILIFFNINNGKISALLYESQNNYEIAIITVQGTLDFLTSLSNIKFGELIGIGTEMYQDFKHISCALDQTMYMEKALSLASSISWKSKRQLACVTMDTTGECTKCKEGTQLVSDKDGNKSCAFSGSVIADQTGIIRYATASHPIIFDYDITKQEVDSINFMINIQIPQVSSSNPVGLIRISDIGPNNERITVISLFVKDENLIVVDRLDASTINALDVLKGEDKSNYLTISLLYDNKIGMFKLQTYSASTGLLHSSEAVGQSTGNDINLIQVQIGFQDKSFNSEKEFRFKASSAYLYVNSQDNKMSEIKKVTYIRGSCDTPCKSKCNDGLCADEFVDPMEIPANNLSVSLSSIDETFVSEEEFPEYFVRVQVVREQDALYELNFFLSNNMTLKNQQLTPTELLMSNIPKGKSSISIDSDMNASFFGIDGLFSLLPSGYTPNNFKNYDVQIKFNSRTAEINVSLGADDLVFNHTYSFGSNNWDIQSINNDTFVFKAPQVKAWISLVNVIEFGTHAVVSSSTNGDSLQNCLQTRIGNEQKSCISCYNGFNNNSDNTKCSPNDNSAAVTN